LLYTQLLGALIKCGGKYKAFLIVKKALYLCIKKTKLSLVKILSILFNKLKVFIEVKTIKKRRKTHLVPFPATKKKVFFLITKWMLNCLSNKLGLKQKAENILSEDIIKTINSKSNSMRLRALNIRTALDNKANLHFRW